MKNRPHKFKKGVFAVRPPEAMQLFEVLVRIFPAFEQTAVIEDIQESENGLHCVMSLFTVYLGASWQFFRWRISKLRESHQRSCFARRRSGKRGIHMLVRTSGANKSLQAALTVFVKKGEG